MTGQSGERTAIVEGSFAHCLTVATIAGSGSRKGDRRLRA